MLKCSSKEQEQQRKPATVNGQNSVESILFSSIQSVVIMTLAYCFVYMKKDRGVEIRDGTDDDDDDDYTDRRRRRSRRRRRHRHGLEVNEMKTRYKMIRHSFRSFQFLAAGLLIPPPLGYCRNVLSSFGAIFIATNCENIRRDKILIMYSVDNQNQCK